MDDEIKKKIDGLTAKISQKIETIDLQISRLANMPDVDFDTAVIVHLLEQYRARLEDDKNEIKISVLGEEAIRKTGHTYPSTYHFMKSGVCHVLGCKHEGDDCTGCKYVTLRCYAAHDVDNMMALKNRIKELENELHYYQSGNETNGQI